MKDSPDAVSVVLHYTFTTGSGAMLVFKVSAMVVLLSRLSTLQGTMTAATSGVPSGESVACSAGAGARVG
ncbi:hypothetical protein [Kushneria aurantia]|uniref:Uncharacterized protein n=1 Tax=Kushneria aurantia TaxID=504092 RepID=A0ABV6G726_9GAMM|nr:hypothetical protein [Kushneria aurantia]